MRTGGVGCGGYCRGVPSVIGFDLDMTLVDSRDAIVDSLLHVAATYGTTGDPETLAATVGLPLDLVFPELVPEVPYAAALEVYRARYLSHGVGMSRALPGALESLTLSRELGESVVVVSAKHAGHVAAVLSATGLRDLVDAVEGERFGEQKGEVLATYGAWAYVGDHPGDVVGARHAGAVAVAVATGPTPAELLAEAGADVVLPDLGAFPAWRVTQRGSSSGLETG